MDCATRSTPAETVRPSSFFAVLLVLLMTLPFATAVASVQSVIFSGAPSVTSTFDPSMTLSAIAVDGAGEVFAVQSDGTTNSLIRVQPSGGVTVLNSSMPFSPQAITVNTAGTALYFIYSDYAHQCSTGSYDFVAKTTITGSVAAAPTVLPCTFTFPSISGWHASYTDAHDLKVDSSGNIYIADYGGGLIWKIPSGGTVPTKFIELTGQPYDLALSPDGSTIYYTYLNSSSQSTLGTVPTSAFTSSLPSSPASTTQLTTGLSSIQSGLMIDSSGNVFVGGTAASGPYAGDSVVYKYSGGTLSAVTSPSPNGANSFGLDSSGKIYTGGTDSTGSSVISSTSLISIGLGSEYIASTSPAFPLPFRFNTGGKLGSINVLTQGANKLDLADAGSGSCNTTTTYAVNATCYVDVTFTPAYSGLRQGAVVLKSTGGAVLATALVHGTGVGPQMAFLPGGQSVVGSGFAHPSGVAMDGSGNVFVADTLNGVVKKILASGGYATVNTLGSGFSAPWGVAVDGSGNVFVADQGNNAVKEILAAGGYTTVNTLGSGFSSPSGVAVDGNGNVFVADQGNNAVKEILAVGGYTTVNTLGSGFSSPSGVAVDGSGNVFVADFENNAVKEILAAGGYTTVNTLGSGFSAPAGVTLDGNGNVFVADSGNHAVKEILAAGGYITIETLASGLGAPSGVSVDGSGNVFVADTSNVSLVKLDLVDAPSLSFATTSQGSISSDSPQKVTVENIGNATMTFPVPEMGTNASVAANFTLAGSTTCPEIGTSFAQATLAAGTSCIYAINFAPTAKASISGSVVLTDDALNTIYATQTINLSGTGTAPGDTTSTTVSVSPNPVTLGQAVTITATVSDSTSVENVPTGGVAFTDTVGGTTVSLNGGTAVALGSGSAALSATLSGAGSHTITASYAGGSGFGSSTGTVKLTVATATVPTLSFAAIATQIYGNVFSVSATSASEGAVTYTVTSGPATISGSTVTLTGAGLVTLSASQAASGSYTEATATVSFTVNKANTTTAATSSLNPSTSGQSVTFTSTISPVAPGTGTPTGTVTFLDGGTSVGTGTLAGGVATFTTSALAAGNHTITASYGGDGNFSSSTASLAGNPQVMNKANTTTAVTSIANPSIYGQAMTFTSTISPVAPGAGTPTGTVTFLDGGTSVGTGTLAGGVATFTTSAFAAGNHTITTSYGGDGSFNGSTGSLTGNPQVVNKAAASVTPSVASKAYGASDPAFTGTLSGFVSADNITAAYSRATGETVAGGPYAINATLSPTGVLANYNITYNTANFTIAKLSASVTPNAAAKVYGTLDPAWTGALLGFLPADNVTASYSRTTGETVAGGPYVISATLSPSGVLANYNVTYNTAAFTISKLSASVTPNASAKVYGSLDPSFTGTLNGFVAGDNITATYLRAEGETVAGGPYVISATLAPLGTLANYNITYNTAAFTISKLTASVTPNALAKVYGTLDPALTGTLNGFVAGDNVVASYSRAAGETVAGGPYAISAALNPKGVAGNYDITYNTAQFTITRASLTATANNASMLYGTTLPTFTGTLISVVPGDGITASFTTLATSASAAGTYPIYPRLSDPNSMLGNYTTPVLINGTLTIGKSASATTVQTSGSPVLAQSNIRLTANVSGSGSVPTGSVSFMDGNTSLGTATLDNTGTATLTLNTLSVGSHSVTAVYAGSIDFAGSTSGAITEMVQDFNFTIGGGSTTATVLSSTVMPGNTAVYTMQFAPEGNSTFASAVTLTLTGLPAGATYSLLPSVIPAGSGPTTVTVTVYTAKHQTAASLSSPKSGLGFPKPLMLALFLPVLGTRKLRRGLRAQMKNSALMLVMLGVLMATGMTACGTGSGFFTQPSQTYPMTLTGTSGALHHSVTLNLTIQ